MGKDLETVSYRVSLDEFEIMNIPEDKIQYHVNNIFANGVGNLIMEKIDELPIYYVSSKNVTPSGMQNEYEIHFNIISKDELMRLKEVEYKYNDLCR